MKVLLRALSLLLVAAMLLSCFVIAGSAADDEAEEEEDPEADLAVIYNRTYDEAGMGPFDGSTPSNKGIHTISAQYEETGEEDSNGQPITNTFIQMAMSEEAEGFDDCYFEPTFKTYATQIVIEVSLRMEEGKAFSAGNLQFKFYDSAGARVEGTVFTFDNKGVVKLSNGTQLAQLSADEWTDIAVILDAETRAASAYVNGEQVTEGTISMAENVYSYMTSMRLYLSRGTSNVGSVFNFDNYRVYEGTHIRDLGDNTGTSGGSGTSTLPISTFNDSVAMKVNVPYAYADKEQVAMSEDLSVAPIKLNGTVYVPLVFVAEQLGYAVSQLSETVFAFAKEDSKSVITIGNRSAYINGEIFTFPGDAAVINNGGQLMGDFTVVEAVFEGYYVTYDDMGLIIIDETEDIVNRTDNLQIMVSLMQSFIYDNPIGAEIYEDALEKADGTLSHPRVLATAEQFEAARSAYEAGLAAVAAGESTEGMYVYAWASGLVNSAINQMIGSKPVSDPVYYYDDGDRMQEWGRTYLLNWAFAYQMILNLEDGTPEKVENRVLKFIYALSQFDDWAPGHFLNCAGNAQGVAIAYDWMYDAWADDDWTVERVTEVLGADAVDAFLTTESGNLDVKRFVEDTLYYYGVASAIGSYNRAMNQMNSHGNFGRFSWTGTENNWNAVCNASMMMCALAMMDVTTPIAENTVPTIINPKFDGNQRIGDENYGKIEFYGTVEVGNELPALTSSLDYCTAPGSDGLTYQSEIQWLMTKIMQSIKTGVICYAPDGSYEESPGYWSYGTGHLFYMMEALDSAAGSTYGLEFSPGVDVTGYFPLYIESSDCKSWGYHDSGSGNMDTSHLGWVGQYFGDLDLAALRYQSIIDGKKGAGFMDVLYFDESLLDRETELSVDYYFQGIETATFRSSWEAGAIFTGLHGGYNSVNHGDMDAGNFIYDSNGIQWFVELGSDNYNLPGYMGKGASGTSWKYYKKGSEGQNTVFLANDSSWIYGQDPTADVPMLDFYSDENGGYAVLDMSVAFRGKTSMAERGLLFTNSRKTVVIQDEILFTSAVDLYWVAHTRHSVELAEGGTVAYLTYTNGDTQYTVRATIVPMSPTYSYLFKVMDATALLAATTTVDPSEPQQEVSRDGYQKLVIEAKNTTYFGCAVVIETIESRDLELGYTYTSIDNWMPVADTRPIPEPSDPGTEPAPGPGEEITMGTIVSYLRTFGSASGEARTAAMRDIARSIGYLSEEEVELIAQGSYGETYRTYLAEREAYNTAAAGVNGLLAEMLAAAGSLTTQAGEAGGEAAGAAGR